MGTGSVDGGGMGNRGTRPLSLPTSLAANAPASGAPAAAPVVPPSTAAAPTPSSPQASDSLSLGDPAGLGAVAQAPGTGIVGTLVEVVRGITTPPLQSQAFPDHCVAAGYATLVEANLGERAYASLGASLLNEGRASLPNGTELTLPAQARQAIGAGAHQGSAENAAVQAAILAMGARLDGSDGPVSGIRADALAPLNEALDVGFNVATTVAGANLGDFVVVMNEGMAHLTQVQMVDEGVVVTQDGAGVEIRLETGFWDRIRQGMGLAPELLDETAAPSTPILGSGGVEGSSRISGSVNGSGSWGGVRPGRGG